MNVNEMKQGLSNMSHRLESAQVEMTRLYLIIAELKHEISRLLNEMKGAKDEN